MKSYHLLEERMIQFAIVLTFLFALVLPFWVVFWPEAPGKVVIDVDSVWLEAFRDGSGINVVDAEIIIVASQHVPISLAGDIKTKRLSNGFQYGNWETRSGDGVIIHYEGLLELTESKSVGDEIEIVIRHGASETRIVAEVGGKT